MAKQSKRLRIKITDVDKTGLIVIYSEREKRYMGITAEKMVETLALCEHLMFISNLIVKGKQFCAIINGKEYNINTSGLSINKEYLDKAYKNNDLMTQTSSYYTRKRAKKPKQDNSISNTEKLNNYIERHAQSEYNKKLWELTGSLGKTGRDIETVKNSIETLGLQTVRKAGANRDELAKLEANREKSLRMDKRDEAIKKKRAELKANKISDVYIGGGYSRKKVTTNSNDTYGNTEQHMEDKG